MTVALTVLLTLAAGGAGAVIRAAATARAPRLGPAAVNVAGTAVLALVLVAPFHNPLPEDAFMIVAARDGQNDRQRQLAFAKIVAGVLADHPVAAAPREGVQPGLTT